jgi:chitodextrinase
MKTLRVTLADIIGPTGTPNSTATVHARYVDTSGRGRDVHLTDGTIVVPVRRVASPDGDPEVFDFDVYANDAAPVREVDYGHLVEVSWTVVAPTGAKSSGVKRVQITDSMASVVQLGLLATPTPVPPYTGGYVTPETYAALVARVVELEDAPGGGGSGGTLTADDTPAAPAEGESATYFVTDAVVWPDDLVWSTDPDGGVEPTITDAALVSMFTLDGTTYAVLGSTFPEPVAPDVTAPTTPTGLSAVAASHTTVNLSWTASTDAVGVTGYEYRVNGGTAVDAGAGVSEAVGSLTASTAYTFHVRAYDAAGNRSAWSTVANATTSAAPDVTAPTTPTGLSATATGSTSVNLAWTASTDAVGVTGYEYRINGGAAVDAGVGVAESVTSLSPSTAYTFEVRAYDAAGNRSAWSTSAGATTDAAADSTPPTVGTLAGSSITSSGFTLTVTGAADETALHATPYRFSTDDGATYSTYQSSAVYAATGLAASTGYTCKHQTRDAAGNTSTGAAVVVTTGVAATGLVATYAGNASNGTPTKPHTFTAAAIGTASADRHVIVAATWSGGGTTNITGITVGGVAATIDATYYNATGPRGCVIARAAVPTGTTADVVVTMSGTAPSRLGVGTWAVTGAPSLVLVDNDANMFTDAAANSLTLTAVADGVVIAHAHGGAADHTWTNLTERYDVLVENGFSGADAATTTTSHTVTVQKAAATYTLQAVTYEAGA